MSIKVIWYSFFTLFIACSNSTGIDTNDAAPSELQESTEIPMFILGSFIDDYAIEYKIDKSQWKQLPTTRLNIHKWNIEEQYLIAQNHKDNPYDPLLWTRIDWVLLDEMPKTPWAFCYTAYNANSWQEAEAKSVDKVNPRTGCNGFPFSRMASKEKNVSSGLLPKE